MTLKRILRPTILMSSIALSICALPAQAAQPWMGGRMDTGLYLGGGVGASRSAIDTTGLTAPTTDESDTGWKLFAGYQFTRYLGIEAAYYDLGKMSFSGRIGATPVAGNFDSKAYALSLIGSLPLGQNFALLGRVGVAYGKQQGDLQAGALTASASDENTDFTYGLGARHFFNPNVAVRAMWDRFRVGGPGLGGENDVDLFSLDLLYRFD